MANDTEIYHIGFFKYEDSNIWQKTGMFREDEKEKLKEYLNSIPYVDKNTIEIRDVTLPIRTKINKDYGN